MIEIFCDIQIILWLSWSHFLVHIMLEYSCFFMPTFNLAYHHICFFRNFRLVSYPAKPLWSIPNIRLNSPTNFLSKSMIKQMFLITLLFVVLYMEYIHPLTWDDKCHFIQHTYNIVSHNSTSYSPFQICIYFLL